MTDHAPHTCSDATCPSFACKAWYWRHKRPIVVGYTQGQDFFHNETVAQSIRETFEGAADGGAHLERAGYQAPVPLSALGAI